MITTRRIKTGLVSTGPLRYDGRMAKTKKTMTRSERCALRAVAASPAPKEECPRLLELSTAFLEGDYTFMGVQREDLIRTLLENRGIDVCAMVIDYHTSM